MNPLRLILTCLLIGIAIHTSTGVIIAQPQINEGKDYRTDPAPLYQGMKENIQYFRSLRYLTINNTTSKKVYVAIAYRTDEGWLSKGWYNVDNNNDTKIQFPNNYTGTVFIYIKTSDGAVLTEANSPYSFCVEMNEAFTIMDANTTTCQGRTVTKVKMKGVEIFQRDNEYIIAE